MDWSDAVKLVHEECERVHGDKLIKPAGYVNRFGEQKQEDGSWKLLKGRRGAPVGTVNSIGQVKQADGSWVIPKKKKKDDDDNGGGASGEGAKKRRYGGKQRGRSSSGGSSSSVNNQSAAGATAQAGSAGAPAGGQQVSTGEYEEEQAREFNLPIPPGTSASKINPSEGTIGTKKDDEGGEVNQEDIKAPKTSGSGKRPVGSVDDKGILQGEGATHDVGKKNANKNFDLSKNSVSEIKSGKAKEVKTPKGYPKNMSTSEYNKQLKANKNSLFAKVPKAILEEFKNSESRVKFFLTGK